jgi:YesN/AraC family two-component response regulator
MSDCPNCKIDKATNYDTAAKMIKTNPYDIVILDIIMPEMDGREAYAAMLAINPNVKVIFSSGYSIDREVRMIVDKGTAGFIQKPFRIDM